MALNNKRISDGNWFSLNWYNAKQTIGLTWLFVLSYFLLSGYLLALDAMAFRDRVSAVLGEKSGDSLGILMKNLDALDRADSSLETGERGSPIPGNILALHLERVKLTTANLKRFDGALLPLNPVPDYANDFDASETPTLTLEALLMSLGTDLQAEFDTLTAALEAAIPEIVVIRSLERVKQIVSELEALEVGSASMIEASDSELELMIGFDRNLAALERALKTIDEIAPRDHPEATMIEDIIQSSLARIGALQTLANGSVAGMAASTTEIQDILDGLAADYTVLQDQLTKAKPALVQSDLVRLDGGIEALKEALNSMSVPPTGSWPSNWSQAPEPVSSSGEIEQLAHLVSTLSISVSAAVPNIEHVQTIAHSLAQMVLAVERLEAMGVDVGSIFTWWDDRSFYGLPPDELYREQLLALGNATRL